MVDRLSFLASRDCLPVHGVTLGCTNGDPDVEIGKHIFVDSKASWEVVPDGVLAFKEGPS